MKKVTSTCALVLGLIASAPTTHAQDLITLTNGKKIETKVIGAEDGKLSYSIKKEFGTTAVSFALNQVKSVKFKNADKLATLTTEIHTHPLAKLKTVWQKNAVFLAAPGSNIGNLGLALAGRLISEETPAGRKEAKTIATRIHENDWQKIRRQMAKETLLEIKISSGTTPEIMAEAEKGLESEDPFTRMSSSYLVATALIKQYKELVAENPRWDQDPEVRDIRNELYNRIFDLLLVSFLDYDAPPETAARSIWEMSRFYHDSGDLKNAIETAIDIKEIYPNTKYLPLAEKFLKQNQNQDSL